MGSNIPKLGLPIPFVGRTIPFVGEWELSSPLFSMFRTKQTYTPVMRPTKVIVRVLLSFSCRKVLTIPYLVRSYSCYEETYPR